MMLKDRHWWWAARKKFMDKVLTTLNIMQFPEIFESQNNAFSFSLKIKGRFPNLCTLRKINLTTAACQSPKLTNQALQKSGDQVDSSYISITRATSQDHHGTQANMFNLKDILTYLRAHSLPIPYDFFADHSAALHQDRSSPYTKLFLVGTIAMIIFTVAAFGDLGVQIEQRLRNGDLFAALENNLMDLENGFLSVPGRRIEGRILPRTDPPTLDENDNFMLPPPFHGLHEDVDGGVPDGMRISGVPDSVPPTHVVASTYEWIDV